VDGQRTRSDAPDRPSGDGSSTERVSAPDVIIIGGGIVGTAAAAFLAESGARVVLYERAGLASGASGANSGVVQHPFDPVLVPLHDETVTLYLALSEADAGFRLPDEPAGLLYVSRDRATVRRLADSVADSFPALRPEVLDGAALQALEPALAPELAACRVQMGYPIPPSASTYAYATLAERRGAIIRLGREATPEIDSGRVVGVRVAGSFKPASAVLVACGPWSSELVDPSGRWRPIQAQWGVVVETELATPPRHVLEEAQIDEVLGAGDPPSHERDQPAPSAATTTDAAMNPQFSLVPAGAVSTVGSTFLEREPDPASWIVPLLVRASSFVPGLADAPIRGVRACARPQTLDGRPLIGSVPGLAGLYVCAGHGPWGISTGPASARLVADLMLGRDAMVSPLLEAERFGSPLGG
jgi:glycine/D-amino acid oxidase-like deaminating enzyme